MATLDSSPRANGVLVAIYSAGKAAPGTGASDDVTFEYRSETADFRQASEIAGVV